MKRAPLFATLLLLPAVLWAPQASATCAIFCDEVTTSDELCNSQTSFEQGDGIFAHGLCEVQCCAPPSPEFPNGNCSTDILPVSPEMLAVLDQNFEPLPVAFEYTGLACGDAPLLIADQALDLGSYFLSSEFTIVSEFDVVEDTGGCNTSGKSQGASLGLLALLGLGGVLRRRRR